MSEVYPLSFIAGRVTLTSLLGYREESSPQTQQYIKALLQTGNYTAVSQGLLEVFVRDFPQNLTNDLLIALVPPHTKHVSLKGCTSITPSGIEKLLKKCEHLQSLDLNECSQLMWPKFFKHCGHLTAHLTSLSLEGCDKVTDHIVHVALRYHPNLYNLNLSGCDVTDDVFLVDQESQLCGQTKKTSFRHELCSVDLSGCQKITSTAIRHLASLCGPHLRHVNIEWTKVDCTALWYLSGYSLATAVQLAIAIDNSHVEKLNDEFGHLVTVASMLRAKHHDESNENGAIPLPTHTDVDDDKNISAQKQDDVAGDSNNLSPENKDHNQITHDDSIPAEDSIRTDIEGTCIGNKLGDSVTQINGDINESSTVDNEYGYTVKEDDIFVEFTLKLPDETNQGSDLLCGTESIETGQDPLYGVTQEMYDSLPSTPGGSQPNLQDAFNMGSDQTNGLNESQSILAITENAPEAFVVKNNDNSSHFDVEAYVSDIISTSVDVLQAAEASNSVDSSNNLSATENELNVASKSNDLPSSQDQLYDLLRQQNELLKQLLEKCAADRVKKEEPNATSSFNEETSKNDNLVDKNYTVSNGHSDEYNHAQVSNTTTDTVCNGTGNSDKENTQQNVNTKALDVNHIMSQLFKPNLLSLNISNIYFHNTELGNACLKALFMTNNNMVKFSISWKEFSDNMLDFIGQRAPELQSISLVDCLSLTTLGIANLGRRCPKLSHVDLRGVSFISDSAIKPIVTNENITSLLLAESDITDVALEHIVNCAKEKIEDLDVSWCEELTIEGLNTLASNCHNLQCLAMRQCPAMEETLALLVDNCPKLTSLSLSSIGTTSYSPSISMLCRLDYLDHLDISWIYGITDDQISTILKHCIHLRRLYTGGLKQLTSKPYLPIIANYPEWQRCQSLLRLKLQERVVLPENEHYSSEEEFEDLCLPHRSTSYAAKLKYLNLEYCDKLNDIHLAEIVAVCRGTLSIIDYYCSEVSPAWIMCQKGKIYLAPRGVNLM